MRRLAIIRKAGVSVNDHSGRKNIVFSTYTEEGVAADQWIDPKEDAFLSLWDAMNGNIDNLNGKACWVNQDDTFIRFESMAAL